MSTVWIYWAMHAEALNVFVLFCVGVKEHEPTEPRAAEVADNTTRQQRYASGQYFFEYLVVVSLKKAKDRNSYEPQITYQFPKVSVIVNSEGNVCRVRHAQGKHC